MSRSYPPGWDITYFGMHIKSVENGYGRRPEGEEDGPIVLRLADVSSGSIDLDNARRVAMSDSDLQKYRICKDDLLFVRVNGSRDIVAKCILVDQDYGDVAYNDHLIRVAIGGSVDSQFLSYIFTDEYTRSQLLSFIPFAPGGQLTINQASLSRTPIPLPPLPEQRKIAAILGAWDAASGRVEQLIAALQRRKQGLMQRLLTGAVRFPEFAGTETRQQTRYTSLPAEWDYVAIGEIAREVSLRNTDGDNLSVLSCTKYDGLVDSLSYFGRQIFSEDTSSYKVVKRRQFAYATNHIEEGSIGYQDLYDAALISPMYTVFETTDRVNDAFLYRLLKTELYRHIFEVNTSGTVNRRGRLGWDDFARIRVPLPSEAEQRKIAEFFATVDREIALQQQRLAQLQAQKKGLMQRLLTGQVRVKVDSVTPAA